jgi:hypothetical protein
MSIYSGFVYIWYDRKKKWFCVGSHFGSLDDGYTSSTGFMNNVYRKRPHDFKRRVLEFYYGDSHRELLLIEQKWLDMIQDHELCVGANKKNGTIKYYNVKKNASGLSGFAASELKKEFWNSERGDERKKVLSEEMKNNNLGSFRKNTKHSDETKEKISIAKKGKKSKVSKEVRSKIMKDAWERGSFDNRPKQTPEQVEKRAESNRGKKRSDESKKNISDSLIGIPKSDEHKENMKKSAKTRKLFTCPHCGFQGRGGHRYHFNNCRSKPSSVDSI